MLALDPSWDDCCGYAQSFLFLMLAEEIRFDHYSSNNKATILDLNNHRGMREIRHP